MQVLRFAEVTPSPWKNRRGTTWEYAVHPPGAGLDDFSWRISRAHIGRHAAFSVFPEIDRTLAVVAGDAIDLLLPDRRVRLDRRTQPYRFAGDHLIECRIPDGPIDDLNVMTRRGRWTHAVERRVVAEPIGVDLSADIAFVVAVAAVTVVSGEASVALAAGDAVALEGGGALRLEPVDGAGEVLTVRLDLVGRAQG